MTKPFNPFASYETSQDLEVQGVWLVEPFFRIRVARAGGRNTKFQPLYESITKPYKRAIQTKTLPEDLDAQLSRELYARAVVTGWSVAEIDEKGQPKRDDKGEVIWIDNKMFDPVTFEVIDFTVENVMRTFNDETKGRGPALHQYVVAMSNDVSLFRDEDAEDEDAKN